jgi:hypothetical protein
VKPRDFLSWAKSDLKGSDRRAVGNALGNVKRALHSQIDEVIRKTRVRFTRDWDAHCGTDTKVALLKKLGIEYRSIVSVITDIRNDFEHKYLVPKVGEARAYYETAVLWLDKLDESYSFQAVAIVGLQTSQFSVSGGASGSKVTAVEFSSPSKVTYFWDSKKMIVQVLPNGTTASTSYSDLTWREMIQRESIYIKKSFNGFQALPQGELTSVFNKYQRWLGRGRL